jgi:hypothetical protein
MYKEYREMSRTEAVDALYQDMAARHRARFRSIQVRLMSILEAIALALTDFSRFSRLLRLRRLTISAVHTSSNSLPRTCHSHFLTVLHALPPRRSLLPSAHPLSIKVFVYSALVVVVSTEREKRLLFCGLASDMANGTWVK